MIEAARNRKRLLTLFLLTAGIAGCASTDMTDLASFVQQTLATKGGQITPLPEIKPAERYVYQAAENPDARDPFAIFDDKEQEKRTVNPGEDTKQLELIAEMQVHEQNPEELENFELDSLKMVGTMAAGEGEKGEEDGLSALALDPDGTIYRVRLGHYMGRNYGKVTRIAENKIEFREIIKDAQGRWEERPASIGMSEEGTP
jgi:type IV pilus assembly protein PilP